jgi:3-hydroxyacyl-[acyl-carrier-protein] dehydratase
LEYEKLAKKMRKRPLLDLDAPSMTRVDYDIDAVKRLLPHRDPFLLVDRIEGIDLTEQGLVGARKVDPDDPIFRGHFPDYPILPGVLQVEMIGQVAICFYDFHKRDSTELRNTQSALGVRALKIYHTLFQHEVLPGDEVKIVVRLLEEDEYKFKGIGQVINGGKVCTIAIAEFYIV